jgi:heat shock protein HslJ
MSKILLSLMLILVFVLVACAGQSEASESIVGSTWQWQAFEDMADENNITVSDPENYTLTLNEDGNASIKADCNQVSWKYELDGSSLTFDTLGPSTLAMCPDGSLDTQFLERLGNTATYVKSDGQLFLNLKFDSGNLVFSPQ